MNEAQSAALEKVLTALAAAIASAGYNVSTKALQEVYEALEEFRDAARPAHAPSAEEEPDA